MGFLLLGACAQQPAPPPASMSTEQRLQRLEGRVESLERRDTIAPYYPLRSREEIAAQIQSLESQRAELLASYSSAHPDVRAIDRELAMLKRQLGMLDQNANTPK
jgi:phage shock protein A